MCFAYQAVSAPEQLEKIRGCWKDRIDQGQNHQTTEPRRQVLNNHRRVDINIESSISWCDSAVKNWQNEPRALWNSRFSHCSVYSWAAEECGRVARPKLEFPYCLLLWRRCRDEIHPSRPPNTNSALLSSWISLVRERCACECGQCSRGQRISRWRGNRGNWIFSLKY